MKIINPEKVHVMVDLETLAVTPSAAIMSIGAVVFDAQGVHEDTLYKEIDTGSCTNLGMSVDVKTIDWWEAQEDAARQTYLNCTTPDTNSHIRDALADFTLYLHHVAKNKIKVGDVELPDVCVWGNGASFDNAILIQAYTACGSNQPWPFWNDRCYRTTAALIPYVARVQEGTHHNALDDAISQAKHLVEINTVVQTMVHASNVDQENSES